MMRRSGPLTLPPTSSHCPPDTRATASSTPKHSHTACRSSLVTWDRSPSWSVEKPPSWCRRVMSKRSRRLWISCWEILLWGAGCPPRPGVGRTACHAGRTPSPPFDASWKKSSRCHGLGPPKSRTYSNSSDHLTRSSRRQRMGASVSTRHYRGEGGVRGRSAIIDPLAEAGQLTVDVVYSSGYIGVAVLIAMGYMHLLVPTGVVLALAGFLVGQGHFSFLWVLVASTIGGVFGSLVLYLPGLWIGEESIRRFIGRLERFKLVYRSDLDKASEMFERHGGKAILIGHLVPGITALVSIPAGVPRT